MKRHWLVPALSAICALVCARATASGNSVSSPEASVENLTTRERYDRLTDLVQRDPAAVLRMAIDTPTRLALPAPIRDFVEESVEFDGTVQILVEDYKSESRRLTFLTTDAGE